MSAAKKKWVLPVLFGLLLGTSSDAATLRIVTLSPALTELVFQVGHGSQVVGASAFSEFPDAAGKLPRVGELFFPSIERVLSLHSDWILNDFFTENSQFLSAAQTLSLKTETVKIDSVTSLFSETRKLLKTVFHEDSSPGLLEAEKRVGEWKQKPKKFRFLFFTWIQPAIVASSETFFADLFTIKGGENLLPRYVRAPYSEVSQDWLIGQHPDIVFFLEDNAGTSQALRTAAAKWWPNRLPKMVGLNPRKFARTSLSPLFALPELESSL